MVAVAPWSPMAAERWTPLFLSSRPAATIELPLPPQREPSREPMPMPPVLQDDAFRVAGPFPPSDERLQSDIEERFVDAYTAQISYLQQAADKERAHVESDIAHLRRIAWTAQNRAAEQGRRADVAHAALRERELDTRLAQQALGQARGALQAESAALAASRAALQRTEWQHAETKARADWEIAEMKACYNTVALKGQAEKQVFRELEAELATARAETKVELEAAREEAMRAELASAATAQAKLGLAHRDSIAEQTLREAVQRLEADFARERADFLEQDRRALARVQTIEREAKKEQLSATMGRAITRPQAAAKPIIAHAPAADSLRWLSSSSP